MRYMLLIHPGDAPTPYAPDGWARLSDAEREEVTTAYRAIDEAPGVSPGVQMQPPETATTVRVQEGKTLTTDGPFVALDDALGRSADGLDVLSRLETSTPWRTAALAYTKGDRNRAADILGGMGNHTDEAYARLRAAEEGGTSEQLERALEFFGGVAATAYVRRVEALYPASA